MINFIILNKYCCAQIRMPNYVLLCHTVLSIELMPIPLDIQSTLECID